MPAEEKKKNIGGREGRRVTHRLKHSDGRIFIVADRRVHISTVLKNCTPSILSIPLNSDANLCKVRHPTNIRVLAGIDARTSIIAVEVTITQPKPHARAAVRIVTLTECAVPNDFFVATRQTLQDTPKCLSVRVNCHSWWCLSQNTSYHQRIRLRNLTKRQSRLGTSVGQATWKCGARSVQTHFSSTTEIGWPKPNTKVLSQSFFTLTFSS